MEAARERRNIASAQLKKGRSGIEECQLSGATLYYVGACGPDPCRNELQLEGVIAERKSSLEPGTRNGAWLKYKINRSQECYWRLHPWHQSIDALIVGCYEGADLKFVAKVRNGFVPRLRRDVFQRFAGLESDRAPSAIC